MRKVRAAGIVRYFGVWPDESFGVVDFPYEDRKAAVLQEEIEGVRLLAVRKGSSAGGSAEDMLHGLRLRKKGEAMSSLARRSGS